MSCLAPFSIPLTIIAGSARLAARAPVGRPRAVALRPGPDGRTTARTRFARPPVDPLRLPPGFDGLEHQAPGRHEDVGEPLVVERSRGARSDRLRPRSTPPT